MSILPHTPLMEATIFHCKPLTASLIHPRTEIWRLTRFPDTHIQLFSMSSAISSSSCPLLSLYPPFQFPPADRCIPAIKVLIGVQLDSEAVGNSEGIELVERVLRDVFCVERGGDEAGVRRWIGSWGIVSVDGVERAYKIVDRVFRKVIYFIGREVIVVEWCEGGEGMHDR